MATTPAPSSPPSASDAVIARIERAVQRDEGGRGIAGLVIPGELERAARGLLGARSVRPINRHHHRRW